MNSSPQISDAESQVMALLWQRAPQTAEELSAELGTAQGWQPATVKTLLNRLLNKGAIAADKDGRRFLYRPLLSREAWLGEQTTGLLDRLFGGSLAPLVAQFSSRRRLSAEDVEALKRLLHEYENPSDGKKKP